MQKLIYHAKNYFNLEVALPPIYFALIYFVVSLVTTPLIMNVIDPSQIEGLMTGEVTRLDFFPRFCFALYEVFSAGPND